MQQLKRGPVRCEAESLVENNMEYLVQECSEHEHA